MNETRQHKTKRELAQDLGMSRSTLYRRMDELGLRYLLNGQLLSPTTQDLIRAALDTCKGSLPPPVEQFGAD